MNYPVRRSVLAISTAGALGLLGALTTTSANAATTPALAVAGAAHAVTTVSHAPNSFGFCFTHWQDNDGYDLPYATFTCLVTGDTEWQGFAQCTDDTVYFTDEHIGAGNDRIDCPAGEVVYNAGVNFLN